MRPTTIRGLLASLLLAGAAHAIPPLGIQGRLTDPAGTPQAAPAMLTLRLYDQAVGGAPMRVETDAVVFGADGTFTCAFGDQSGLAVADLDGDRWIGITVDEAGGGAELAPRVELRATSHAFRAGVAAEVAPTASLDAGTRSFRNVGLPVAGTDAVTLAYQEGLTGTLGELTTQDTSSLVAAINELVGRLDVAGNQTAYLEDVVANLP